MQQPGDGEESERRKQAAQALAGTSPKPPVADFAERKNITCLFADVVGSTQRVNRLDAEEAAQFLNSVTDRISAATAEYGGTVIHRLGDGIVAVFGAPVAVEDHAIRACHAALAMQRLVSELSSKTPRAAEEPIAIRVGIATGEALVQRGPAVDAFGITVHIASRLQALAQPGEVYIGEETYSAVRNVFECSPLGFKSIKGVDQPVAVFRLVRANSFERPRFGLQAWDIDIPFVGRSHESALIADAIARLAQGQGSILAIWGEAGLGKSRLITEARLATDASVLWLEGFGVSFGRTISYLPFFHIIRRYIGVRDTDDDSAIANRLSVAVRDLFPDEADDVLPYLATFMGIEVERALKGRVMYLDGEQMGLQIRRSLRLLFQKMARRRPTVLVFEDFYSADDSSMELLEHLLSLPESEPLTICFVGRGEANAVDDRLRQRAAKEHASVYVEIALTPLRTDESEELLNQLFSTEPRLMRLRERITENSEGNPLYIEEVLRTLLESKTLVRNRREAKWSLTSDPDSIRIPNTIHDVIAARVDRLPDPIKQVLTVAAAIGRIFDYRVLQAFEAIQNLDEALAELLRQEFIVEKHRDSHREYAFYHAMIQEVTYDGILKNRRRQIHRQVGEILETLFGERVDKFSGVLAYHFGRAEIWEKAQIYLFRAGEKADRLAADAEALYHYRQAVDACMRAFGDKMDRAQQVLVYRKVGEAYYRRGEHAEAIHHFELALQCIGRGGEYKNLNTKRALLKEVLIQCAHALRLSGGGKSSADSTTEHQIDIYRMMVWIVLFDDPARYILYTLAALNEAERRSHAYGIGWSSCALVFGCNTVGFVRLARYYHRKGVRAGNVSGSPIVKSMTNLVHGWYLAYAGRWNDAIADYAESADLAWQIGDLRSWGSSTFGQSLLYCHQGRFAEAWDLTDRILKNGEASGDRVCMRTGLLVKGMLLLRLGRLKESETALRSGLELSKREQDLLNSTHIASELGTCLMKQNRFDEAETVLGAAETDVRTRQIRGHSVAFLRRAEAELEIARAELADKNDRAKAVKRALHACDKALSAAQVFGGAQADALRLKGNSLFLAGRERDARHCWLQALAKSRELDSRYLQAQIYMDMGRLTGSELDATRGKAMLAQLAFDETQKVSDRAIA